MSLNLLDNIFVNNSFKWTVNFVFNFLFSATKAILSNGEFSVSTSPVNDIEPMNDFHDFLLGFSKISDESLKEIISNKHILLVLSYYLMSG